MLGFGALGQYALGEAPEDDVFLALVADSGAFTWSGQSAGLSAVRSLSAGAASFTVTGQDAGLRVARAPLSAGSASFTWNGQSASVLYGYGAGSASFTWNGQSASVLYGYVLHASPHPSATGGSHFLFAPLGGIGLGAAEDDSETATTFVWQTQNVQKSQTRIMIASAGAFTWSTNTIVLTRVARILRLRPGATVRASMTSGSAQRASIRAGGGERMKIRAGQEC